MPFHHITNNNANTNVASSAPVTNSSPATVYSMEDLKDVTTSCVSTYLICCINDDVCLELNPQTQRLTFPESEITQEYIDSFASELTYYASIIDENSEEIHRAEWNCFKTQVIDPEYLTPRTREMIRQLTPTLKQSIKDELEMSDNEIEDRIKTIEDVWFYYCYALLTYNLNDMTVENTRELIEQYRVEVIHVGGNSRTQELDWVCISYSDPE